VQDLVQGLNAIGATPRDLISILRTLKAAGALHADLEVL
jgi:flagellar P-ring protein precursor FlgI